LRAFARDIYFSVFSVTSVVNLLCGGSPRAKFLASRTRAIAIQVTRL
jgi:hypothetical protein